MKGLGGAFKALYMCVRAVLTNTYVYVCPICQTWYTDREVAGWGRGRKWTSVCPDCQPK